MISIIKGSFNSDKTMKIVEIANNEGNNNKNVLIIRRFSIEGLLPIDNIIVAKSSDENISSLILNADVIIIDEIGSMIEGVELVHLANLGKQVYYTAYRLESDMPFDKVIEVN